MMSAAAAAQQVTISSPGRLIGLEAAQHAHLIPGNRALGAALRERPPR